MPIEIDYTRYLILKVQDIFDALSANEIELLDNLRQKINLHRLGKGKMPSTYICVEQDWPEYPGVKELLENRIDKQG